MKKMLKRLCTGFLALATVVTALPTTTVHAESKQYWTESAERVGIIEKVMNDGSIGSTFNEGMMKVEGETAYCIDINTDFKNGYKTRADASSRMSANQISDVALSLEYVKQYGEAHKELNYKQVYLLGLTAFFLPKISDWSDYMNDIFRDMQANVGCDYLSDLPSYKRKVWQEMKRLNPADYEERQLEDFSNYVFGMSYQTIKDVMKQQKGREEQCRKQGCWWKREEQLAKKQYHTGLNCR